MDILDNYLDTMFSRYPLTPKTQDAKRELRAMMEDAYNGALAAGRSHNEAIGQAIAEFGNIDEIAPTLGNAHAAAKTVPVEHIGRVERPITMAQAQNFIDAMKRTRWLLGVGVALIVFGAAPFLGLAIAYGSVGGARENLGLLLGFALMLPLIGVGVGLLVYRNQQLSAFRRIVGGMDRCTSEIAAYANALQQQESSKRTLALVVAIMLWILSGLPLVGAGIYTQDWPQIQADPLLGWSMALTLVLVSLGLLVFLPANWMHAAQVNLTQTSPEAIAERERGENSDHYPVWVRAIFAGFWLIITAIYLAWSFITGNWGTTWIIWPISAIAFGAFAAIAGTIYSSREQER
ncbi:permease prefix domain 1-containing protein [Bifidobacterium sp.]|jgi:hypothetical protein|uniref:permease prefix domain 1-containing protein n=1 Tax=Bifidobacterium sp. TaxID=41200 RepID=UPI0025BD7379|nr:permease prefix domain 1-containing protein [Bifidobacterium sp.]MCH4208551.1 permease prefix domain 1-containing protein [Bifidobacterium sp.]MCI1224237.1 permease prefix domain 1-containing protein [Bifidobacterium sp.]